MKNIIIISDDKDVFAEIKSLFDDNGFQVIFMHLKHLSSKIDILKKTCFIFFNLEYSMIINEQAVKFITQSVKAPLFIFSRNHQDIEKRRLIQLGAHTYVKIPFSPRLWFESVKSIVSFIHNYLVLNDLPLQSITLKYGPCELDFVNRKAKVNDQMIKLTRTEFRMLEILCRANGQTVEKEAFLQFAWDHEKVVSENALNIHILRLRKKLEIETDNSCSIETIWGVGYKINTA